MPGTDVVAQRFTKRVSVAHSLAEVRQREAEIVLGHGPVERHPRLRVFLQRGAIGGDRLGQMLGAGGESPLIS